jgi:hypothetical protein
MEVPSVIPALGRLRQEDYKFKTSLGDIARPYIKNKTKQNSWALWLMLVILATPEAEIRRIEV